MSKLITKNDLKAIFDKILPSNLSSNKQFAYTGEYVRLVGSKDTSTGSVTLSTSAQNCFSSNTYNTTKSPMADDLFSISNGVITINKTGYYRIDYQVYFYSGFTAGDIGISTVLLNGTYDGIRASRLKFYNASMFTTVSGTYVAKLSENATVSLGARNETGARGTFIQNNLTRINIECLGIYE